MIFFEDMFCTSITCPRAPSPRATAGAWTVNTPDFAWSVTAWPRLTRTGASSNAGASAAPGSLANAQRSSAARAPAYRRAKPQSVSRAGQHIPAGGVPAPERPAQPGITATAAASPAAKQPRPAPAKHPSASTAPTGAWIYAGDWSSIPGFTQGFLDGSIPGNA